MSFKIYWGGGGEGGERGERGREDHHINLLFCKSVYTYFVCNNVKYLHDHLAKLCVEICSLKLERISYYFW